MTKLSSSHVVPETPLFSRQFSPLVSLLIMLAITWSYGMLDYLNPPTSVGDVDDLLRAFQIRDLVEDGQWFDRVLPQISLPSAYESPWARLVDGPYFLVTRFLSIFLSDAQALQVSFLIVPPLLLVVFISLVNAAAVRINGGPLNVAMVFLLTVALLIPSTEFVPGRIDHHNFQLVCLAGILLCLACTPTIRSGAWIGALIVFSVIIGLELLPLLCIAIIGLTLSALDNRAENRQRLIGMGSALSVGTFVFGLAFVGPQDLSRVACDGMSAPYAGGLLGAGLILCVVPQGWVFLPDSRIIRFLSIAVPTALLLIGLAVLFPLCLSGPYHMIDPVSQQFWLSNVIQEETTLTLVYRGGFFLHIFAVCVCLSAVILTAPAAVQPGRAGHQQYRIIWAIALLGIILAIYQIRFTRIGFASGFMLIPLAATFVMRPLKDQRIPILGSAFIAVALFIGAGLSPLGKTKTNEVSAYDFMVADPCNTVDISVLSQIPPGRIMVAFGILFPILEADTDHTISAIPFHRSSPGINEMARTFSAATPEDIGTALDHIDYIAVCARDQDIPLDSLPLYKSLVQRKPWPGFTLVAPVEAASIAIYRVD